MAKVQDTVNTEDKLKALFLLQTIDSKIDEIRTLRGELPIEVEDLEDELAGLQTRIGKLEAEIAEVNTFIKGNEELAIQATSLIERYKTQLDDVKNNRQFEALTKEIEMQQLEIQLARKKSADAKRNIEGKVKYLAESKIKFTSREKDLVAKKEELEVITAKTRKEESTLKVTSEKAELSIEKRLLMAYKRVRSNYRNGLGVVEVDRDSCGGCFGKIPPQMQLEISHRKKIITCEHCGRILVDKKMQEEVTIDG